VSCRWELFVAILLYVTLDLSLPAMPGAFVFDAADSVESAGGGRVAARAVILSTSFATPVPAPPRHCDVVRRLPMSAERPWAGAHRARHRPRASCNWSPSSDDPH
jgi:hypothetical protein